jgi:hypothetical protein
MGNKDVRLGRIIGCWIACAAILTGACRSRTGSGATAGSAAEADAATRRYGYAPIRDRSITYQPDVVIVQGGAHAIRSASADALTWTIDGTAPGAEQVRPGKVMFVTGRAVGRVVDVRPAGRDLAVTLMPVQLTEIIRDAHLKIDQSIPIERLAFQEVPRSPTPLSVPQSGSAFTTFSRWTPETELNPLVKPAMMLDSAGGEADLPAPSNVRDKANIDVSVGDWEVRLFATSSGPSTGDISPLPGRASSGTDPQKIGVRIRRNTGLRVSLQVAWLVDEPRFVSDVRIIDGKVTNDPDVRLEGINAVEVDIAAGVDTSSSNTKARAELPVNLFFETPPTPTFPLPMVYSIRFRFMVETALTGSYSTLQAHGLWVVVRPADAVVGSLQSFELVPEQSILDSLRGMNIGVSGIVLAAAAVASAGVGTPILNAGPYVKHVFAVGLTKGSVLGAPLVVCKGASASYKLGVGVGLSITASDWDAIAKRFTTKWPLTIEPRAERLWTVWQKTQTKPNVLACRE